MKYLTSVQLEVPHSDGTYRARFRVRWNDSRSIVSVNLGYNIDPSYWSAEACRCHPRSFHGLRRVPAAEINAEITRYENAARSAAELFDDPPSVDAYRTALRKFLGRRVPFAGGDDMVACCQAFIMAESSRSGWSENTCRSVSGLIGHIKAFQKARGCILRPDDFTSDLLAAFALYLQGCGLKDATVEKWMSMLSWFFNWCVKTGRMSVTDYKSFGLRVKPAASDVIFLDWDEIQRVRDTELPPRLERTRDAFLFQCFTGLRYSDLSSLRRSDIGPDAITLTTQKTADHLRIELNKYSRAILEKYRDMSGDRPLPVPTDQAMNRDLKEIGRLCSIDAPVHRTWYAAGRRHDEISPKWSVLTTHAGRRSFVCLMLRLGVPATTVMQWTGHSDYKAMLPYIAVSDSARAEAMSLLDKL